MQPRLQVPLQLLEKLQNSKLKRRRKMQPRLQVPLQLLEKLTSGKGCRPRQRGTLLGPQAAASADSKSAARQAAGEKSEPLPPAARSKSKLVRRFLSIVVFTALYATRKGTHLFDHMHQKLTK